MNVEIQSRKAMEARIPLGLPRNVAVISFYTPMNHRDPEEIRVNYSGACDRVFFVGIPDIDVELLPAYGYTYETYLGEADALVAFIRDAISDGCDLICQCDYGQSRSAACAAAILQHTERRGIDVFADFRYYPNQLVYRKVFEALERLDSTGK